MKKRANILLLMLLFFVSTQAGNFTVIIDAGHGGKDPGAVRGKTKEKDINLQVALAVGKLIENGCPDVDVLYTRKTDVFVELRDRANKANRAKGNLFISIHTNSTEAKKTTASGADTYILGLSRSKESLKVAQRENSVILLEDNYKQKYENFDPNSPESYIIFEFMTNKYLEQSIEVAGNIQHSFKTAAKRSDRGVRQDGFLVLRETAMPSILIELGFINNESEAKFLSSAIGSRTMASAIYEGFKKYKANFDNKQGIVAVAPTTKSSNSTNNTNTQVFVSKPKTDPIITIQTSVPSEAEVSSRPNTNSQPSTPKTLPARTASQPENKISANEIEYRVQIAISREKLSPNSPLLKGLSPVSYYQEDGIYKYTYGSSTNRNEMLKVQRQLRANNKFKDAFVVSLKNNKRVK